jgi:hypothetical protein
LITNGPDQIEPFLNVVDMLAAFDERGLYAQVVRATQESVKTAELFELIIDAYYSKYLDTYLFEYLELDFIQIIPGG